MESTHPITLILKRWPSRQDVYEDALAANPKLGMVAVHRWFQRGSLPAKYDGALLDGAERRGIGLHHRELIKARAVHTDRNGHASRARQERRA